MELLTIPQLRKRIGEEASGAEDDLSVATALLLIHKLRMKPHILPAQYPVKEAGHLDGLPILFAGTREGIDEREDFSKSCYRFPVMTMEGLLCIPLMYKIPEGSLIAFVEPSSKFAGDFPLDWVMSCCTGRLISTPSLKNIRW